MIARLLRIATKVLLKRGLRRGVPGAHARLTRRAKARSPGSAPVDLEQARSEAKARGYHGLALQAIASGELPLPPRGHDPYAGCPPRWGYADYIDGSVACLPPLSSDIRRRNRMARRR